jgi:hypothetical protein
MGDRTGAVNFKTSQLLNFRVQGIPNTAFALAVVTAATSSKLIPLISATFRAVWTT